MTAVTVTVVAALEGCERVALTDVVPPASSMVESATASATVGAASSSVTVSVSAVGSATPLVPDTVAETVTVLFGASVVSSVAATVTAPLLAVEPAPMISVFAVDSVKPSPAAATVNVTAALDAPESVAVTVATPPASEMDEGDKARVAVGVPSSSVRVRGAPVTGPTPCSLAAVPVTVTARLTTLSTWSSTAVSSTPAEAFAVAPATMTRAASVEPIA